MKKLRKRQLIKVCGFRYKRFKNNQYWIFKNSTGGFTSISGDDDKKFVRRLYSIKE